MATSEAHRRANSKYQKTHRERVKKYQKGWRERRMAPFNRFKEEEGCRECGMQDYRCLDFHHKDSKTKKFAVNQGSLFSRSEDALWIEVEKCEVLCANCHRIRHALDRISP